MKTTADILLEKYSKTKVTLAEFADDFPEILGVQDKRELNRLAAKQDLGGIRPFKMRNSKRCPWLIDLVQAADAIDRKAIESRR